MNSEHDGKIVVKEKGSSDFRLPILGALAGAVL